MMLPSQKIELAIYQRIKGLGPGAVSMTLGILSAATGEDHNTLVERLKSLEAEGHITLFKNWAGARWNYRGFAHGDSVFFFNDGFVIEIVPQGRKYFETLEQESAKEAQKRLVFISCGQYVREEIQLGEKLAAMVSEHTGCEGYFAQNQNSLAGLSAHIFRALDQCVGFVGVMHHRGVVETLGGSKHTRGSVWIEQEIAIAAFLTATRNRDIPVLLYIQKGIKREGVREQLKLNPIEFDEEADVLTHFVSSLKNGTFKSL
jgi:hypothetical protein